MKIVIQRVISSSVKIGDYVVASIDHGYLILLGIETEDTNEDIDWLVDKIISLRIFSDADDKMNLDIRAVEGDIIVVSQFTLQSSTKKGNRPSYLKAARPELAIPLYEQFLFRLEQKYGRPIQSGQFGADMQVSLINDGPVTIIIDSKNRV